MNSLKVPFLFSAEIVFFVLTGMNLMVKNYWVATISLIFAVIIGGYAGKYIAKEAVEEYKKKEVKNNG